MIDIYAFLNSHKIQYRRFDHPAVFTCEEAKNLCPDMPGIATKNLFLRDKNGERHFLVSVSYKKSADIKKLKELLGVTKLSFASPERLQKYLGVAPGSVTLLGLVNDAERAVEIIIDDELWASDFLQCHPLVNTASLAISHDGMKNFFLATGHEYKIMNVPQR